MKKLLLATVTLAALMSITPALAGNAMDKGVAAAAVYTKYCDATAIPSKIERMLDVYVSTRGAQVLEEMIEIRDQFSSIPDVSEETAAKMWCALMKPEIAKFVRGTLTSSR
jgi:hypothetical protein